MEPTIQTGRGGDVRSDIQKLESMMESARTVLTNVTKTVEAELDVLQKLPADKIDAELGARIDAMQKLSGKAREAIQTVLNIEMKLMAQTDSKLPDPPAINLEEARAEIERRLARLAA